MTTSIEHQIRLILVTWTCVLLQSVRSSSVPIATSPIVSSITSTIRSTSVDSVVTTSATCIGCDDTSVFCTTQGTVTECLDAAVSESFVTETIHETNVATRTTVVGITVGFTTIYSDVADVATPGTSITSSATVLPAAIASPTTPTSSQFYTKASSASSSSTISTSSTRGASSPANFPVTGTGTTADLSSTATATDNGVSSPPSSNGMSTGTKAALGAAIALGVILVGTGVYLFLKRRRNTTNPPVAMCAEPSTDPKKYDGQSNRFFYARKASTEQQVVTATITNVYELDGCSAEQPPIEHMMPHEVGGNPVYHSQGNPLHESGGQGRCETSGNPRYEIHGHPRDNYEAVSYNYEVT